MPGAPPNLERNQSLSNFEISVFPGFLSVFVRVFVRNPGQVAITRCSLLPETVDGLLRNSGYLVVDAGLLEVLSFLVLLEPVSLSLA